MRARAASDVVLAHRLLRRYVLPGERVVLVTRRHWAKLAEPFLTCLAVLVGCAWLSYLLEPSLGEGAYLVLWLWFAALVRFGWLLLLWRVEWFVATDKRMLLLTGLVTHRIGMMPLVKVTDMRYSRSLMGQLLGYGQFLLESAGQDQALRQIDWVANPDATYRQLCALIFTPGETTPPEEVEEEVTQDPEAASGETPEPPAAAPAQAPPVVVPGRGYDWAANGEHEKDDDSGHAPGDTQPLRVTTRTPPEPPAEDEDPGWSVSEPSAVFVDLRQERDRS